jgi:nitroreductase
MGTLLGIIQSRHSERVEYDPNRPPEKGQLEQILEAGRWAPTAHNMQNYEIIVVDDKATLRRVGAIRSRTSLEFLRENYQQLSFSKKELLEKRVGILGSGFPAAWRDPSRFEEVALKGPESALEERIDGSPMLLIVIYDPGKRAPASEGDVLGFMSLGCVMENMWLMAESLGLGFQILSTFANRSVEKEAKAILRIPDHMRIAYAIRVGHLASKPSKPLRVRRNIEDFAHRNMYGRKGVE